MTNNTDTLLEQDRIEAAAAHARAVAWVSEYDTVKQALEILTARKEWLREALERYMALERLDRLDDPELGIAAVLKERKGKASIDLVSAARLPEHAAHIVEAAQMGLLEARRTPLRAQAGKAAAADALLRYEQPGGVTTVLTIESVK